MKKAKIKSQTAKESQELESTYWIEYTYTCPKRGRVTERIQVKKLKAQSTPDKVQTHELDILKENDIDDER
jgi:hypothetical protein